MPNSISSITIQIIRAQEQVIGPVAIQQASKVSGLKVDWSKKEAVIDGDSKKVLSDLISQYEHLFGQASVEVCKDAVKNMIDEVPKDQLPSVLTA